MEPMKVGDKVYYDSLSGLVPGKVTNTDYTTISVKVTAKRPGYYKGEIINVSKTWVVLRSQIHVRNGQYVIWPRE